MAHHIFISILRKEIYTNMSEYFEGKWSDGVKKSYTDRKGNSGEVDRFVAKQPFVFKESKRTFIWNRFFRTYPLRDSM